MKKACELFETQKTNVLWILREYKHIYNTTKGYASVVSITTPSLENTLKNKNKNFLIE